MWVITVSPEKYKKEYWVFSSLLCVFGSVLDGGFLRRFNKPVFDGFIHTDFFAPILLASPVWPPKLFPRSY